MKNYDKQINQLIKMYIQGEKRLINIISDKKVKGNVVDFYESMLKQVKLELMQLQMKSANYSKDLVNELYLEAYYKAMNDLSISNIGDGFAQLHTDAIELLSDNIINNFAEVNNQVGRRIEDTIRDIGLTNAQMKFATGQTIRELQNELINSLVNEGIGGITDKRGRVIPFTTYSELLARSIVAETQNTSVMKVAKEHKKDLVKMTQHNTSCGVCKKYEGKIYSISGKDKRYPKLNTIPGFNKGYNNIHPRCRHRISIYIEKYNQDGNYNNSSEYDKSDVLKENKSDILSSKEWLNASFSSQKKFEQHFKHLKEYNNIKPEEYLEVARQLLAQPLSNDIEGFVSNHGWVFKYRKSTNDFVIGHPRGTISTLFKPNEGYLYFLSEKEKYNN